MFWRAVVVLIGALFLALAANDVHEIVTRGGPFAYTFGTLHCAICFVLGLLATATGILLRREVARFATIDFLRDAFSRRNMIEFAVVMTLAVVAAAVQIALVRRLEN